MSQEEEIEARRKFKDRIDRMYDLQRRIASVNKELQPLTDKLKESKAEIKAMLEASDELRAEGSECKVSLSARRSVVLPKTEQDWAALYSYLKENGHYDGLITIKSGALNDWFNEQEAAEMANGNPDFTVPGLGNPNVFYRLSVTKKQENKE